MANYNLHVQPHSRKKGHSAISAAAYRSGENLRDHQHGKTHRYSNRRDVVQAAIIAPEGAPDWVQDRETLWNQVEVSLTNKDARVCRDIQVSLPRELSRDRAWQLLQDFAGEHVVSRGMIADIAFHESMASDGKPNPHGHILITTRKITAEGFKGGNPDWNRKSVIYEWREAWERMTNTALAEEGSEARIDQRSHYQKALDAARAAKATQLAEQIAGTTPANDDTSVHVLEHQPAQNDASDLNAQNLASDPQEDLKPPPKVEALEPEHMSRAAIAMEARGMTTRQGEKCREAAQRNFVRRHLESMSQRARVAISQHVARLDAGAYAIATKPLFAASEALRSAQSALRRVFGDRAPEGPQSHSQGIRGPKQ